MHQIVFLYHLPFEQWNKKNDSDDDDDNIFSHRGDKRRMVGVMMIVIRGEQENQTAPHTSFAKRPNQLSLP